MSMDDILERLDLIIRLLGMSMTKDEETQKEKIIHLSRIGLKPIQIANILNTTSNSVNGALSKARKAGIL